MSRFTCLACQARPVWGQLGCSPAELGLRKPLTRQKLVQILIMSLANRGRLAQW